MTNEPVRGNFEFPCLPAEAVRYLREERGIILAVDSLRNRRRHKTAKAGRVFTNTSLWTQEELDAIVPSSRTKMVLVESVEEDEEGESKGTTKSVVFKSSLDCWSYADEVAPDLDLRRLPVGAC